MNPFPDVPAESPLTERERSVVSEIADRERAADPAFARRLSGAAGRIGAGRTPVVIVAVLAALGVALLLLPGVWVLAGLATALLVVVPTALVTWALRQGDRPPD